MPATDGDGAHQYAGPAAYQGSEGPSPCSNSLSVGTPWQRPGDQLRAARIAPAVIVGVNPSLPPLCRMMLVRNGSDSAQLTLGLARPEWDRWESHLLTVAAIRFRTFPYCGLDCGLAGHGYWPRTRDRDPRDSVGCWSSSQRPLAAPRIYQRQHQESRQDVSIRPQRPSDKRHLSRRTRPYRDKTSR